MCVSSTKNVKCAFLALRGVVGHEVLKLLYRVAKGMEKREKKPALFASVSKITNIRWH